MLHNLEPVIRNRNSTNPHRTFQATFLLRQSFIWEEKPNLQKEIPPAVFTGFYLAQTFFFGGGGGGQGSMGERVRKGAGT